QEEHRDAGGIEDVLEGAVLPFEHVEAGSGLGGRRRDWRGVVGPVVGEGGACGGHGRRGGDWGGTGRRGETRYTERRAKRQAPAVYFAVPLGPPDVPGHVPPPRLARRPAPLRVRRCAARPRYDRLRPRPP